MQNYTLDAVFYLEPLTFFYAVGYRYARRFGLHVIPLARRQAVGARPAGLREGGFLVAVAPEHQLFPGRFALGTFHLHGQDRLGLLPVERAHLSCSLELFNLLLRIILLQKLLVFLLVRKNHSSAHGLYLRVRCQKSEVRNQKSDIRYQIYATNVLPKAVGDSWGHSQAPLTVS